MGTIDRLCGLYNKQGVYYLCIKKRHSHERAYAGGWLASSFFSDCLGLYDSHVFAYSKHEEILQILK